MPASWAAEALQAQAVVARSTRCATAAATASSTSIRTRARRSTAGSRARPPPRSPPRATRALAVRYGVEIAQTFFHSTSGGRTAGYVEGFGGGLEVPYLRPVEDSYDDISPVHTWRCG